MCLKAVAQPQRVRAAEILRLGLASETDQAVSSKEKDERAGAPNDHYLRICLHNLAVQKHEM